ncbi:DNA polymerase III subunit gamma/tau [Thiobacillus sp.]|uniref:DNA polymerase III subunit gamma/tau n=1 Tax=Thiobacillus sp. TaxID=924 RepID=UPI0017CC3C2B|nr:DNA polymerase III subunit gamma/tau [Thiobacillus sp.]MBC2731878.1 DNA polymerase III subunit gamma/tau [Thiobacillus sp.]MBC2740616.1 DNA polymerase III subunit gamma/tau [Thiobacillus sp.]MBC2758532.1 DNA polymerase III subunit gamma/tau [Thiobacillus sp.]
MTDLFGESSQPALALARKWRPRAFADLKGQEHVVQALSNALTQGRLHHAYLLTGTRGVGKTTLARILAKCLNCETGVTATPCGVCSVCTQIDAGRFVDLLELDAASNTGVDNMREVLDNAQYAPTVGRYKVYIIDEVHMLSKPAFNSMLKTLEEPPAHVKFILATTDPQKIPVTVLSRCLQFNLKPMPPALVAQHLGEVLEQEKVACEPAALNLLARAAAGSMRDALSLTDQAIAYGGGTVEAAAVEAMLGTVRRDYLFDLLDALAARNGDALLDQARQLAERGIAFDATLQDLGNLLTQLALLLHAPGTVESSLDAERMQTCAAQLDAETVQLYYQIALNGRRDLPYAPDEFSGFCMTLLRMLAFAPGSRDSARAEVHRESAPVRTAAAERVAPAIRAESATRAEPPMPAARREAVPSAPPAPAPTVVPIIEAAARATVPAVAPVEPAVPSAPVLAAREPGPGDAWDWLAVVAELRLGGMAKMLADHCELVTQHGDAVTLRVGESHKHLLDRTYQDKLVSALKDKYGAALQITFEIGAAAEQTPQQVRTRIKEARQAEAVAAIESDPFVRDLVDQFGGQIDASTIQPLGEST